MWGRRLAVALLAISLAVTAWLIVGSFVTYAPAVTATKIQNIYIERTIRFGCVTGALQLGAIIALLFRNVRRD